MMKHRQHCRTVLVLGSALLSACAPVGPDFVRPDTESNEQWSGYTQEEFLFSPQDSIEWWGILNDPVLDQLVVAARQNNNNIRIAGLRVLESRAALGIALGNRYPQAQVLVGDATALGLSESNANFSPAADLNYTQYNLGVSASWELDF